jgi:hypothetical protein
MCIFQPRSLLFALLAVTALALAPPFAAAQRMARPAAGSMSRPMTMPGAGFMGPVGGFRPSSFGMMAYPGMSGSSPYGASSRGSSSGMGGYGGGMSGSSYGSQGGQSGGNPDVDWGYGGAIPGTSSGGKDIGRVLTAAGVPNDDGRLRWPVGLRAVGGAESDELRRQIEALFQYGVQQTQAGPVSPHLVQELAHSVGALRQLVRRDRQERFSLALTTYEDAERFLTKLDHARKLLEADPEPAGGKASHGRP